MKTKFQGERKKSKVEGRKNLRCGGRGRVSLDKMHRLPFAFAFFLLCLFTLPLFFCFEVCNMLHTMLHGVRYILQRTPPPFVLPFALPFFYFAFFCFAFFAPFFYFPFYFAFRTVTIVYNTRHPQTPLLLIHTFLLSATAHKCTPSSPG